MLDKLVSFSDGVPEALEDALLAEGVIVANGRKAGEAPVVLLLENGDLLLNNKVVGKSCFLDRPKSARRTANKIARTLGR